MVQVQGDKARPGADLERQGHPLGPRQAQVRRLRPIRRHDGGQDQAVHWQCVSFSIDLQLALNFLCTRLRELQRTLPRLE